MSDSTPRPLLPHVVQQHHTVAPVGPERRERSYVFVDEQNRHRRLKVVRACEGCRKRKIRCDSANTMAWPCAACVRLKMNCVPPAPSFDNDDASEFGQSPMASRSFDPNDETPGYTYSAPQQHTNYSYTEPPSLHGPSTMYQRGREASITTSPSSLSQLPLDSRFGQFESNMVISVGPQPGIQIPGYNRSMGPAALPLENGTSFQQFDDLNDLTSQVASMNLSISNKGVAPYIVNQKGLAAAPALQEEEVPLPQNLSSDPSVRIPPEMMPTDNEAWEYFDYFFKNIHPYVPVLNPAQFYRSWQTDKHSISPLILEAIFACSAHMMNQTETRKKWLGYARRDEEHFQDIPRLSTIQGLLLVLKAREALPKRGYYYRSWRTVVNLVAMAKDLEIDQHYERHQTGEECGATTPDECATRTRVWHMLFAVELIIGGPQGKTEFGVPIETIDFDGIMPLPGLNADEIQRSQDLSHFLRIIKNVRTSSMIYTKLRKKKTDWATDTDYVSHNRDFAAWLERLPAHLQINYSPDGSAPWIRSHFVANLHAYHHLSTLIHYRPQLETLHGSWKQQMMRCNSAAKNICRLQEAILNNSGLAGLLHMLRGVNFHIYAILTCTCIHQVALASPDPEINQDAAEYFARHMRLLEQCSGFWPEQEMQMQINSLRQAFSADISKPFELKAIYPYGGSPGRTDSLSPPPTEANFVPQGQDHASLAAAYNTFNMASPDNGPRVDYATGQTMLRIGQARFDGVPQPNPTPQQQSMPWNPKPIFDQWSAAFPLSQSQAIAHTPPSQTLPLPGPSYTSPQLQEPNYSQYAQAMPNMHEYMVQVPQPQTQPQAYAQQQSDLQQPYVTANMWHDAVASSYGRKRGWNTGGHDNTNPAKRSR